jgi:eukaryotic-like serine/threonine-protein kinase
MENSNPNNGDLPTLTLGPDLQANANLARTGMQPEAGRQFGHYRILRLLGVGGVGQVWDAEDTNTGRRLALKVLTKVQTVTVEAIKRFEREGQIAATINHPNCVYIFGAEEICGYPVISMEIMPGGTLQDQIRKNGPLPIAEAVDRILGLVDGLESAHQAGVLHRDIKPSNCFLNEDGHAKIGDFGLSRTLEGDSSLTVTGSFLGTPSYASPEQVKGRPLDVRSDIYSVGATLYALLTGKPPFEGAQVGEILARIVSEPPAPFSQHAARIPAGLKRVIFRVLSKDTYKRYPNYAALRAQLMPYSSTGLNTVTLGRRLGAFILDYIVVTALFLVLYALSFQFGLTVPYKYGQEAIVSVWYKPVLDGIVLTFFMMLSWLLYFFICEKFWERSLGKRLLGLKVVNAEGGGLSYRQSAVRSSVFVGFYLLPAHLLHLAELMSPFRDDAYTTPLDSNPLPLFVGIPLWAAIWIFARRRNGFAGLHELASKTRVRLVRRQVTLAVLEIPLRETLLPEDVPANFGPYRSKSLLWKTDRQALVLAYDAVLNRGVWIFCYRDNDDAPGMKELRETRAGMLHWLNGRRESEWKWDAFEKPSGSGFTDWVRSTGPLTWHEMRWILLDILLELAELRRRGMARALFH